jgi:CelD/BcsL family acetyltransferase involved in cellulose biosynthesis
MDGDSWITRCHRSGNREPLRQVRTERWCDCRRASYTWLESWWREYGRPGRLRLALVRRNGRLVAAAPLILERRGPWSVLTPLGGAISDFTEALIDEDHLPMAAVMLSRALLAAPGWDVLDVREGRPGSGSDHLRHSWPGPDRSAAGSICLELPGKPLEELLADLPARAARTVRTHLRRIDAAGLSARTVPAEQTDDAIAAMLGLHEQQWRGRGVTIEHLRPRYARHLTRTVENLVADGQAFLTEYRQRDQLVVCDLALVGGDFLGGYFCAIHPDIRRQINVATLLLRQNLARTAALGLATFSLLRGEEPYKNRWRPVAVPNQRLLLAKPARPLAASYLAAVQTHSRAIDIAKQRLPELREARRRLRTLATTTSPRP